MISIEKRREIYINYFINLESQRKISRELNISRNTVSKIIKEYRLSLEKNNLLYSEDLSQFIDLIVTAPQMKRNVTKKYRVEPFHLDLVEQLVNDNEQNRVRKGKSESILRLFSYFNSSLKEDDVRISYSTFYNLVRQVKK